MTTQSELSTTSHANSIPESPRLRLAEKLRRLLGWDRLARQIETMSDAEFRVLCVLIEESRR